MRIPPNQVFIFGLRGWEEWDCLQQPLPERIKVLLCLIDGAERRLHLQAKLKEPVWLTGRGPQKSASIICWRFSAAANALFV